jgi:hypothetical protein
MRPMTPAAAAAGAVADGPCPGQVPPAARISEIARSRLVPGAEDADFAAAARNTMAFLCSRPGFARQVLSRDDGGVWTDHADRTDLASAEAAAAAALTDPDVAPFMAAIDITTLSMRHGAIAALD